MHTHKSFPWEGDTDSYMGTLSSLGNSKKTGREMRGKAKCNKQGPRTRSLAGPVRDEQGNELHIARTRNRRTRQVVTVKAQPEVVRAGITNNIGLDYS